MTTGRSGGNRCSNSRNGPSVDFAGITTVTSTRSAAGGDGASKSPAVSNLSNNSIVTAGSGRSGEVLKTSRITPAPWSVRVNTRYGAPPAKVVRSSHRTSGANRHRSVLPAAPDAIIGRPPYSPGRSRQQQPGCRAELTCAALFGVKAASPSPAESSTNTWCAPARTTARYAFTNRILARDRPVATTLKWPNQRSPGKACPSPKESTRYRR